jgi:hypothetical protein
LPNRNLVVVAARVLHENGKQPDHLLERDEFARLGDGHHRDDVVVVVVLVVGQHVDVL